MRKSTTPRPNINFEIARLMQESSTQAISQQDLSSRPITYRSTKRTINRCKSESHGTLPLQARAKAAKKLCNNNQSLVIKSPAQAQLQTCSRLRSLSNSNQPFNGTGQVLAAAENAYPLPLRRHEDSINAEEHTLRESFQEYNFED